MGQYVPSTSTAEDDFTVINDLSGTTCFRCCAGVACPAGLYVGFDDLSVRRVCTESSFRLLQQQLLGFED